MSIRFQPGEDRSRGFLRDYEPLFSLRLTHYSTLHGSSLPLPDPSRGYGGVSQHIQTSSPRPMAARLIVHLLTLNLQLSDAQTFKSCRESKDNKDGR